MTGLPGVGRGVVAALTAQSLVFGAMAALLGIVANAMFLDAYGSGWLPATYIAIGMAGIVVSGAIARTAQTIDLLNIALAVLGGAAAGLALAWLVAARGDAAWVSVPLLVLFPILIQLGFVFIGGQAGRLLDIAGIKARFPRIMAGFPVGAVLGGLLGAELVSRLGRTEDLLLATAAAQALFAGLVWLTGRRFGASLRLPEHAPTAHVHPSEPRTDDRPARATLRGLFSSPFVLLVLAYQLLSAIGSQLADFLVFDRAVAAYPDAADLARFLAGYTAVMNVVSIGFLVVLAGPLLRRYGLGLGIAANPAALALFAGGMAAVNAVAGGMSLALLWVVSAARIADIALTDGTTRTSINAIYQVIPERSRLPVQTAVEGIGVPVAIGISGVLILVLNALPLAPTATIVATLVVCVVWTWVGILLYRAYGPALVEALHRRPVLAPAADMDATAEDEAAARDLLTSADARGARLGIDMLAAMASPGVTAELGRLARDARPEVRLAALAELSGSGDEAAGRRLAEEVRDLLEDEDVAVRRAALESVQADHVFAIGPAIAALHEPRTAEAAAGAIGRLGDAALPALAEALAAAGSSAPPATLRLVRAVNTRSAARDEILRAHLGHRDRELALAVIERLISPGPADAPTATALDAVMLDEARHAGRILAALAAGDGGAAAAAKDPSPADEALRRALRDELDLAAAKVRATLLARHGSGRLGPVMVQLGAAEHGAGRSSALAQEALGVLLDSETSRMVLALLQPGLSIAERLDRLPATFAGDGVAGLTELLRELVEDRNDRWRSSWLRACAINAARARRLLETLDLGPARSLGDPLVDEVLRGR